jgi:hypothetical protein
VVVEANRRAQIFAPDLVCINSGFALVSHLVENPVAHGSARLSVCSLTRSSTIRTSGVQVESKATCATHYRASTLVTAVLLDRSITCR